jgi:hypothetical protein
MGIVVRSSPTARSARSTPASRVRPVSSRLDLAPRTRRPATTIPGAPSRLSLADRAAPVPAIRTGSPARPPSRASAERPHGRTARLRGTAPPPQPVSPMCPVYFVTDVPASDPGPLNSWRCDVNRSRCRGPWAVASLGILACEPRAPGRSPPPSGFTRCSPRRGSRLEAAVAATRPHPRRPRSRSASSRPARSPPRAPPRAPVRIAKAGPGAPPVAREPGAPARRPCAPRPDPPRS